MNSEIDWNSYINKLNKGNTIGFGWKPKLKYLLNNKLITEEEYKLYYNLHINEKNKQLENLKCQSCAEIINAGTYGIIFNSKNNVNQVIKGSIKGHSITTGCPKDYEHEINMYSIIYKIFKSLNLKNINIIDIQNKWVENRRCYYEMDRIYPFQINEELKIKIFN